MATVRHADYANFATDWLAASASTPPPATAALHLPPIRLHLDTRDDAALQAHYLHGSRSQEWMLNPTGSRRQFVAAAEQLGGQPLCFCVACRMPAWQERSTLADERWYCAACVVRHFVTCAGCNRLTRTNHVYSGLNALRGHVSICHICVERGAYFPCGSCGYYCEGVLDQQPRLYNGSHICQFCLGQRDYRWCEQCKGYYVRGDRYHRHPCTCKSRELDFAFPLADGGAIPAESYYTLQMPAGVISEEGMQLIVQAVHNAGGPWQILRDRFNPVVNSGGPVGLEATTTKGSFAKRLAREMFKHNAYKATPALLAAIGTLAATHSSKTNAHKLAFTRNLDQPPANFLNAASCWFTEGDYHRGMCCFKQVGGMAIRFFATEGRKAKQGDHYQPYAILADGERAIGRAWVMPMTQGFEPTLEPSGPAYLVFNIYGLVSGTEVARVLSTLVGRSYKRVTLSDDNGWMSINNNSGYLVASPELLDKNTAIRLNIPLEGH